MMDFVHLHDIFAMFGARCRAPTSGSNKDDDPGMFQWRGCSSHQAWV
jgi:hypothetical protein